MSILRSALRSPSSALLRPGLQGTAFGAQLLVAPTTVTAPWTDNGDGTYSIDGSQAGTANIFFDALLAGAASGKQYLVEFDILARTAGTVRALSFPDSTPSVSVVKTHRQVLSKTDGNTAFNFQADADFSGTIGPISIREIL